MLNRRARDSTVLPTMKCAQCNQDVHIRLIGEHDCSSKPPMPAMPPPPLKDRGLSSFFRGSKPEPPSPQSPTARQQPVSIDRKNIESQAFPNAYKPSLKFLSEDTDGGKDFDFDSMLQNAASYKGNGVMSNESLYDVVSPESRRLPPQYAQSNSSASLDSLAAGFSPMEISRSLAQPMHIGNGTGRAEDSRGVRPEKAREELRNGGPGGYSTPSGFAHANMTTKQNNLMQKMAGNDNLFGVSPAAADRVSPPVASGGKRMPTFSPSESESDFSLSGGPSPSMPLHAASLMPAPVAAPSAVHRPPPLWKNKNTLTRLQPTQPQPQPQPQPQQHQQQPVAVSNREHRKTGSSTNSNSSEEGRDAREGGLSIGSMMKSHPTKVRSIPVSPTGQLRADGQVKGAGSPPATPVDTQICISSRKTPVPRSFSASASPTPTHVAGFAAADMASPERKAPSSLSGGSAAASWSEKAVEASNPLDVLASLVGPTHGRKQSLVSGLPQINTQIGGHVRAASHNVGLSPALAANATRVPSLHKGAGVGVGARGLKSAKLDSLLDDLMGEMQVLSAEVRNESDRDSIASSASNTSPVDAVRRGRFDSMVSTASTGSTLLAGNAHKRLGCATCGTAVSQAKGALVQAARIPRSGDLPAGIQGVEHQGRVYCVRDYRRMFPLVCPSCSLPCEASKDVSVHALDAWWHRACFNCQECRQPFPDKSFYVFEQRPYCRYDYHKLNNSLCGSCKNPIEGPCAQVYEGRFHPACFACSYCSEPLRDVYYSLEGKFLCENHVQHQKSHKNANKRRTVFGNI